MRVPFSRLSAAIRALSMDAVEAAASGHPGMPLGMADVATALFQRHLKFSAAAPQWADRDRFVLSAGHGSMLLYSLLYLCGYADFPLTQLKNFRRLGAHAAGHPEYGHGGGIETTTGPLGQGLANAVGMALAERLLAADAGSALCDHRTWVIAGDGCLMEGISHEAASFAGHWRLAKLTVLFDDNRISIDGDTSLAVSDDTLARFAACGWNALRCDGHDEDDINRALAAATAADKPTLIACRTTIGFGAPNKQNTAAAHGAPLGAAEVQAAKERLGWTHAPFEIPPEVLTAWREIGARGNSACRDWARRLTEHPRGDALRQRLDGALPNGWDSDWQKWRDTLAAAAGEGGDDGEDKKNYRMATRQASGKTLETLTPALPALIGGSADLTGSNNTHAGQTPLTATDAAMEDGGIFGGYIHYGVREHGMAAMMNGLALHGGFIPYGGTFLVFSDYCRPAVRLSAMTGAHVIYIFTHDSIGLGEDGPTHQPVEHLAALRAMPGLAVYRPCDALETADCWHLALTQKAPAVLALSRQALPLVAKNPQCARGAYLLSPALSAAVLTIAASGSEVSLALEVQAALRRDNIHAAVVSAPCLEHFCAQPRDWQRQVMPPHLPLLAIEAAHPMPWQALAAQLGARRFACIGMSAFGASAPAAAVFEHFGFTVQNCAAAARALLQEEKKEQEDQ